RDPAQHHRRTGTRFAEGAAIGRRRAVPRTQDGHPGQARLTPMPSTCLAFAEASHGSDLAGIQTRGDIVGSELRVTGVKTWVAEALEATAALVLCITESHSRPYENLSCVLVPIVDNGVELRPICTMSGESTLFEVSFDGARAALDNILGGRGNGWQ